MSPMRTPGGRKPKLAPYRERRSTEVWDEAVMDASVVIVRYSNVDGLCLFRKELPDALIQ